MDKYSDDQPQLVENAAEVEAAAPPPPPPIFRDKVRGVWHRYGVWVGGTLVLTSIALLIIGVVFDESQVSPYEPLHEGGSVVALTDPLVAGEAQSIVAIRCAHDSSIEALSVTTAWVKIAEPDGSDPVELPIPIATNHEIGVEGEAVPEPNEDFFCITSNFLQPTDGMTPGFWVYEESAFVTEPQQSNQILTQRSNIFEVIE